MKEAAKAIGVSEDEVKQLLERRELHGYRDGADWKFKVEDIERVPSKHGQPDTGAAGGDEGDVLLSEVELGRSDAGARARSSAWNPARSLRPKATSAWPTATFTGRQRYPLADSDTKLARSGEARRRKRRRRPKVSQFEELDLTLDQDLTLEDSNVARPRGQGRRRRFGGRSDRARRLDDDDLVLGGSGTGSDITIGGDSGISLVDPADSGLSLEEPLNLGTARRRIAGIGRGRHALASRPTRLFTRVEDRR